MQLQICINLICCYEIKRERFEFNLSDNTIFCPFYFMSNVLLLLSLFFILLQTYANGLRFVLTILGGAIAVMGSKAIKYPSAGALGCVTVAFIAGIGWKRQQEKLTPKQQQIHENVSLLCVQQNILFVIVFIYISHSMTICSIHGQILVGCMCNYMYGFKICCHFNFFGIAQGFRNDLS